MFLANYHATKDCLCNRDDLIPTRFLCLSDQEDSTLLIGLSLILSRSKEIMGPAFAIPFNPRPFLFNFSNP
ncbi:hypothetical protein HanRHA438_Chr09g0407881 [Helianthus annuus]|nr:hypothetical protein HanIR_Chr09g0427011 [Helianthus annuus]KAJ0888973.1 hypothetical protein HanRHA438_Chr09g0407881 [Helianthus annuus]